MLVTNGEGELGPSSLLDEPVRDGLMGSGLLYSLSILGMWE